MSNYVRGYTGADVDAYYGAERYDLRGLVKCINPACEARVPLSQRWCNPDCLNAHNLRAIANRGEATNGLPF